MSATYSFLELVTAIVISLAVGGALGVAGLAIVSMNRSDEDEQ